MLTQDTGVHGCLARCLPAVPWPAHCLRCACTGGLFVPFTRRHTARWVAQAPQTDCWCCTAVSHHRGKGGGAGAAPVAQPAFQRRPCCGCTLCALDSPSASAHVQCKQRFVGEGWAGQGTTGGGGRAILPCLHFCQVSCCNFHFHPALIWHARCGRPIRPPQLVCPVVLLRPSCKWAHVCTSQASHEITILML
jgi:hypothetical protein